jgi:hypothetical protein
VDDLDLFAAFFVLGVALALYLIMPDLPQAIWLP